MNLTKTLLAASVFTIFGGAAFAATVNPDTFLGSADLGNSGDPAELAAMCDMIEGDSDGSCGLNLLIDEKYESSLIINQDPMDANVFYVEIAPNTPGWFLLKMGTGNTGEDSHYFYTNLPELSILAWDITDDPGLQALWNCVDGDEVGDECKLSHITTFVPIPAAGWLLIGSLGGLLALRRRKS